MVMSAFSGFVIVSLFGIALAQPKPDACPAVKTMPNFEINKFLGTWYTQQQVAFDKYVHCATANYTLGNGGAVQFHHTEFDASTELTISWVGRLIQPDPNEPGKLKMTYPYGPIQDDYWILHTDYDDVAIVYRCKNVGLSHTKLAWILTRKQKPLQGSILIGLAVLISQDLSSANVFNESACLP